MNKIIEASIENSITYKEYKELVKNLLAKGLSTGEIQNEDYLNYSKLSNARMKRLDKTFELNNDSKEHLKALPKKQTWLVITEGWCGDAAHALPVLNKIAEFSEGIDLKLVLRDENPLLMDQFLTNGSRSIPKLIALDQESNEVLNTWGPRPSKASRLVADEKEKFGSLSPEFKKELQVWYNKNKGLNTEEDMLKLLCLTVDCI